MAVKTIHANLTLSGYISFLIGYTKLILHVHTHTQSLCVHFFLSYSVCPTDLSIPHYISYKVEAEIWPVLDRTIFLQMRPIYRLKRLLISDICILPSDWYIGSMNKWLYIKRLRAFYQIRNTYSLKILTSNSLSLENAILWIYFQGSPSRIGGWIICGL